MSHHHDEPVQKESALVKILEKEKELEKAIADAKVEADRIVREAEKKAEEIVSAAKKGVVAAEQAVKEARERQKVKKNEVADWEKAEAEALKKKIAANMPKAVEKIVSAVLPD